MRLRWSTLVIVLACLLGGCGNPLPPDKLNYAGEWQSPEMAINITREGRVNYVRRKSSGSTRVSGPVRAFEGNDFVVGLPLINTRFSVSKPPTQENGKWVMVVDGVELTKR